jgi:peptidyl-tRNA hydrolase, PTH1 family
VGLGNPGKQYALSRHNIGFRILDRISEITGIPLRRHLFEEYERGRGVYRGKSIVLVKPLTFMNNSGRVIRQVLKGNNAAIEDLVVICDHLDLPMGIMRLKTKGSAGGHKGLASIISYAGTVDFKRLYIGIGRPEHRDDVVDYVLEKPSASDRKLLDEAVDKASEYALLLLEKDPFELMNIINRKE